MIWGTLNLREPDTMSSNNTPTLQSLYIEIVKLNLRWRIAVSILGISMAGITTYSNIKMQELQTSIVNTEVVKSQVTTINDALKDLKYEQQAQRALLTDIAMDKGVNYARGNAK